MPRPHAQPDHRLADRVARREDEAVDQFRRRFTDSLDRGFDAMSTMLSETHPPGCTKALDVLLPHVAGAAGEGYLKLHGDDNVPLDSHVPALALADLFHASACLRHDDAACLRLVDIVDREVGPPLVRRFRQKLSAGRAQEIIDDVLSHTWSKSRSSRPGAAGGHRNSPRSASPRRLRLETYLGLSTLKTWLHTIANRMLLDEVNRPPSTSLDMEESSVFPRSAEPRPVDDAETEELVRRYRPRIEQALHSVLDALRNRPDPRLAQVAYLWLHCRSRQVDIAGWLGVTKARVSQQVSEITRLMLDAAAPVCEELATVAEISPEEIRQYLKNELREFFPPVVFEKLTSAFRDLGEEHPSMLHVAYLAWRQGRDAHTIANQLAESESRVLRLAADLDDWREQQQSRIARELHEASDVPEEMLQRRVALAFQHDCIDHSHALHLSVVSA